MFLYNMYINIYSILYHFQDLLTDPDMLLKSAVQTRPLYE